MVAGKGFTLGLKKKMNKIKDDELDTNVQSEGYKTGGVQWGRPMRKQVTDANEQK